MSTLGNKSAPDRSIGGRWLEAIVVGFTHGSDPRDFLRTATRANTYPVVRRLWAEWWQKDEVEPRIDCVG